jgi:hypothetical protein
VPSNYQLLRIDATLKQINFHLPVARTKILAFWEAPLQQSRNQVFGEEIRQTANSSFGSLQWIGLCWCRMH